MDRLHARDAGGSMHGGERQIAVDERRVDSALRLQAKPCGSELLEHRVGLDAGLQVHAHHRIARAAAERESHQ